MIPTCIILILGWLVMLLPSETIASLGPASCFPSGRASPGGGDLGTKMPNPLERRHIPEDVIRYLRMWISYNPETGIFTWVLPKKKVVVGSEAGYESGTYREISFSGYRLLAHRLAWILTNGPIPDDLQVDHINGNRMDNRIANLRLVTHQGNCENKHGAMSTSKSGLLGASWCGVMKRWVAVIKYNRKKRVIGYFGTPEEAHQAYLTERRKLFPCNTL